MVDSSIILAKEIFLVNNPDEFVLVKGDKTVSVTKSMNPVIKNIQNDSKYQKMGNPIDGILGVLECKVNNYLMTIVKSTLIGTFLTNKILKVEEVNFVSYTATNETNKEDLIFINQAKDFFKRQNFYYSTSTDLTISFYARAKSKPNCNNSDLFRESYINFLWNYTNTRSIDSALLQGFVFPIINGFVCIKPVTCYEKTNEFHFGLISKKDNRRNGYRFIVRGADSNGNCANFVETEQFIITKEDSNSSHFDVFSYVQLRGSIPLIWSQNPNLQLNPPVNPVSDFNLHLNAYNRHIADVISNYDRVCLINLIDKKGDQNKIGELFHSIYMNNKQNLVSLDRSSESSGSLVEFSWFEFHRECKKMKYENISKLLKYNNVSSALSSQDFTQIKLLVTKSENSMVKYDITKTKIQKGVFRTNCMDSLDRTNVIQSVFARQFLHKMLYRLNISEMPQGNPFEEFNEVFEKTFRYVWGDNGDYLSRTYSGTNAMKRDFVRIGKRTLKGNLEDGMITMTRFYYNNFCDGYNQDCHDYYLGALNPKKKNFKQHSTTLVNSLIPVIFIGAFLLYGITLNFCLKDDPVDTWKLLFFKIILFSGMIYVSATSLLNGFKKSIIDMSTIPH